MRVLVIDDEPDVRLVCRVNLGHAGHEVLEASDARGGLEVAAGRRPDVIVLDVMLPDRDGIGVLRELVTDPATAHIPVVLLTAKAQIEDRLRGWRGGCAAYVTKPFSPPALLELLHAVWAMGPEQRRAYRDAAIVELGRAQANPPFRTDG